jgi:hypothetical protein
MLESLRGKVSDRKLRLFGVACCRRVWRLLTDERSRKCVDVVELSADGQASRDEVEAAASGAQAAATVARETAQRSFWSAQGRVAKWRRHAIASAATAAANTAAPTPDIDWAGQIASASSLAAQYAGAGSLGGMTRAHNLEWEAQACLMRELFAFAEPLISGCGWLTQDVILLAQALYEEKNFADLPILADTLEEAGCNSPELLAHLRGRGPHVLGCWALDAVLKKG